MPTPSQNSAAAATAWGDAVIRLPPRMALVPGDLRGGRVVLEGGAAGAGPVHVLAELLDDVLPQLVEGGTQPHPGVLAGPAEEGVDAQAEGADLGAGDELGDGLELRVVVLLV